MTDKLVEEIARAICAVASRGGTLCEGEQAEDNWDAWIEEAEAAATISNKRIAELEELIRKRLQGKRPGGLRTKDYLAGYRAAVDEALVAIISEPVL